MASYMEKTMTGAFKVFSENPFFNGVNNKTNNSYSKSQVKNSNTSTHNNSENYKKTPEELKNESRLVLFFFVFICIAFLGCWFYWRIKYEIGIEAGMSAKKIIGMNYEEVVEELSESGFEDINCEPIYDLSIKDIELEYTVAKITIDGEKGFKATDRFHYDSDIIIEYHAVKDVALPISSDKTQKMNYEELVSIYKNAGFVNIVVVPQNDLITGWITKDGSVESVTVDGNAEFSAGDCYRPDVAIEIMYHTF